MKLVTLLLTVFAALNAFAACGDCQKTCSKPNAVTEEKMGEAIVFDNSNNLVCVKANLGGKEDALLILDTGASYTVIDSSFADRAGVKRVKKISETTKKEYDGFDGLEISFGDTKVKNQEGRIADLRQLSMISGQRIDGILGYDFIKSAVLEINYGKNYIKLHSPENFSYSGSGEKMKLEIRKKWPVGKFTLVQDGMDPYDTMLIFDSGSMFSFSLNFCSLSGNSLQSSSTVGVGGIGGGGRVGRLKEFVLAGFRSSNPLAAFPADDSAPLDPLNAAIAQVSGGIIGGQLMRKFNFVFDYSRGEVYIEKNSNFDEPSEYDMSGMFIVCSGGSLDSFVVMSVSDGSPADSAGIMAGDRILSVGEKDAAGMTLWELKKILMIPDRSVEIKIERENDVRRAALKTRRLL